MKNTTYLLLLMLFLSSCQNAIKNEDANVQIEDGTEVLADNTEIVTRTMEKDKDSPTGFWVGYFEADTENHEKKLSVDDGYYWNRENKINISIDSITDVFVMGHSVVAGNNRPFSGSVQKTVNETGATIYTCEAKEPGDDKYDGTFKFVIKDNQLTGTWLAFKKIDVPKRVYTLEPKPYKYDPTVMLEQAKEYVNWNKKTSRVERVEIDKNEFEDWIYNQFATATELIYNLNASSTLLTKKQVENLKKGDLTIIRNNIYARHGYSFKNRPLRVFFDAQKWYIPVHTDIKAALTDIEKENIKLLLRYEKNAAEYYDSFGRG